MKKNTMAFVLIALGAFNVVQTLSFNTDGYKIEMAYINWSIFGFSILVMCYGLYLLLKKKKSDS